MARGNAEVRLPLVERGVQALAAGAVGKDTRGKPFEPVGGPLTQPWLRDRHALHVGVPEVCAATDTQPTRGLVLGA